jgi:hypothetical protein
MDLRDYLSDQARSIAALGDATEALQAIVDAGLPVPSGFYMLQGRLRLHGPWPGPSGTGQASFVRTEQVTMACRECLAAREWLAPVHGEVPGMTGVPLWCGQCDQYRPHDVAGTPSAPRSFQETWEAARVLEGGYEDAGAL